MSIPHQDKPAGTNLRPKPRRFRLSDGMILIVAAALGFAATTVLIPREELNWGTFRESWNDYGAVTTGLMVALISTPTLFAITLALIPIRCIRPRPRRWMGQPGMVAALATLTYLGIIGTWIVGTMGIVGWREDLETIVALGNFFPELVIGLALLSSVAVSSSWVALIASRRWRPEPGWIDRTGRVLGIFWILYGIVFIPAYFYAESNYGHAARSVKIPQPAPTPAPTPNPRNLPPVIDPAPPPPPESPPSATRPPSP